MRILTRYVLLDLAKVFFIALTGLTLMMILIGLVKEAATQGLPLAQVVRLIPYILPDVLRVSVPVTLLLAVSFVFGRMSGSNEIVAVKALGISPMELLSPVYIVAFALSLVTVWMNDVAVSWGRSGIQRVVVEAVEEIAYSMLQAQHRYSSPNFSINVKRVEGRRLILPTLTLNARGSSPTITITAEEAELRSDRAEGLLKVILRNGTVDVQGRFNGQFPDTYEQEIPLRDASRARETSATPSSQPLLSIPDQVVQQQARIQRCEQEMAAQAAYQMLCGDFAELTGPQWEPQLQNLQQQRNHLFRLLTEPHRRWSAGFACLCFVWVGAPISIFYRHRDFLTSFFLCFLPILIVYYPLLAFGVDGAKNGTLPPWGVWAGNVLLLAWGGYLLRKVIRY